MSDSKKKKNILKKECYNCGYFNPAMGAKRYKCAILGKCPGVDWSSLKKKIALSPNKYYQEK